MTPTVLLAMRNICLMEEIRELLSREELQLICADDMDLAFDILRRNEVKFIICEISRNPKEALHFLKELKKINNKIPVLLCTDLMDKTLQETFQNKNCSLISKPIQSSELRECTNTLLKAG